MVDQSLLDVVEAIVVCIYMWSVYRQVLITCKNMESCVNLMCYRSPKSAEEDGELSGPKWVFLVVTNILCIV